MRDFHNVRMLPEDRLKKVERRLPPYGRAALRRLRNSARSNEAIEEGKWHKIAVETPEQRFRLRCNINRLERYLNIACANHDAKAVKELSLELQESQQELADYDTDREIQKEQLYGLMRQTEGSLLSSCERFLSGCEHYNFVEVLAPVPAGNLPDALTTTRDTVAARLTDVEDINRAPVTLDEAVAQIDTDIEKFARAGAPDIYMALRFLATNGNTRRHGFTRWPEVWTGVGGRTINDGFSLMFWALKDVIREKLVAEAAERIESSAYSPIAIADRAPLEEKLRAEILELERTEEAIISALQAEGDSNAVRRSSVDPRAVLGIAVVKKAIEQKSHGSVSLAQYENPKVETPDGQSLPRSSKWVTQGARLSDTADD